MSASDQPVDPATPRADSTRFNVPPPEADRTRITAKRADPDATGFTPTALHEHRPHDGRLPLRFGGYELERGWRWSRRIPAVASLLTLVLLLLLASTGVAWLLATRAEAE